MKFAPPLLALLLCAAAPARAEDAKTILNEDFAGPSLPAKWQPGGRPHSFSIAEGALRGVAQPDDAHGPSIGVPIEARDIEISFRVKLAPTGYFLFLLDGESAYGGAAHLLRVSLSETVFYVAQDRGSLASKEEQRKEKIASGKPNSAPTKEQLADPKYYRTERLAQRLGKYDDDQWHQVKITVRGQEFTVQLDDQPALTGQGTVFEVPKSRLVFLVAHGGTVLIDDVKARPAP